MSGISGQSRRRWGRSALFAIATLSALAPSLAEAQTYPNRPIRLLHGFSPGGAADAYTLRLVTGAHAISGALYKKLAYDPTDSFEVVSTLVYYALVIAVRADSPAKTLPDLIAMAKQKPNELSFGSVGFGSTHHLAGELLTTTAGIKMVHVPYRGDSLTVTALLGGEIPIVVGTPVL